MLELLKRVFHKHQPVWDSREVIKNISIDFTLGPDIDIQSGKQYLYKGKCLTCGEPITKIVTIADIFDQPQPFDI